MVTLNCTSWPTAKKFIKYTEAHVILVQEIKLEGDKLAEASQYLAKQGWKSILEGADRGDKDGLSSGVGIFVRD